MINDPCRSNTTSMLAETTVPVHGATDPTSEVPAQHCPGKNQIGAPGQGAVRGRRVVGGEVRSKGATLCDRRIEYRAGRHGMAEPVTVDEQRMAVPRDVAARISRLSVRKIDYWARTQLVEPTVDTSGNTGRVRLYSFLDLLALVVAAELNARGVSVRHIRHVVEHLKSRGYNRPLSELTFATVSNRVYFQHDDGTWEGDLRPDQLILREVLDLEPLRQRIAEGARRDQALVGKVERRRGALGNKPLLAGTRVPVETIQRYLAAGRSTDDVLEAFPMLTVSDVEAVRRETVA